MKALHLFLFIVSIAYTSQVSAQTVFTTKTGEKYHLESCHYLKYSKKEVKLEDAIARGYDPCSVCKPTAKKARSNKNTSSLNPVSREQPPARNTIATRCTGKTKAGSRCKRKTKNSNGRCYQH